MLGIIFNWIWLRPISSFAGNEFGNKNVADIAISMVDISGTFAAGMGNEETRENYRMLGAIAVHRSGAVFFKLTGPFATIAQWEQSFNQFLDSLTTSEKQTEKRVGGV